MTAIQPLEARDLVKRFGRTAALAGISLSIQQGSVTALVGPNGAGKSTLMKSWVGFERPTSGSAAVWGLDAWTRRRDTLPHLAYVPQRPALYGSLSVGDHMAIASHYRPSFDQGRATRHLGALGIAPSAQAGNLSGGQAAQLGLAIALGTAADTLVLDEPLASLDPLARREFLDVLVDDVRPAGRTVVLSSHVVSDIAQACDRIIVLVVGRKMLDVSIAEAIAAHRVTDESHPNELVGKLGNASGRPRYLVRGPSVTGEAATLDDIVMGYLAAGREPNGLGTAS
jgi:ABC-2 type transport system ATP-binding protein